MRKTNRLFILVSASLFFLSGGLLFAQDKPISNSVEVGFNAMGYGLEGAPTSYIYLPKNCNCVNGLFIKKHLENKSYRFGVSYTTLAVDSKGKNVLSFGTSDLQGDYSRASIFAGGEKNFISRKIFQFYWGMDLSLNLAKYTGSAQNGAAKNDYLLTQNGIGITPFIAARATLARRLRISLEARTGGNFYNQKEQTTNALLPQTEKKVEDSTGFDNILLGQATVSYLF